MVSNFQCKDGPRKIKSECRLPMTDEELIQSLNNLSKSIDAFAQQQDKRLATIEEVLVLYTKTMLRVEQNLRRLL